MEEIHVCETPMPDGYIKAIANFLLFHYSIDLAIYFFSLL